MRQSWGAGVSPVDHKKIGEQTKLLYQTLATKGAKQALSLGQKFIQTWEAQLGKGNAPFNVYFNMGAIAIKASYFKASEQYYRFSLNIKPDHEQSMIGIADCLFRSGEFKKAKEWSTKAFDTKKKNQHVASRHFCILFANGDFEDIKTHIKDRIGKILNSDSIPYSDLIFLALNIAVRDHSGDEQWLDVYKSTGLFNTERGQEDLNAIRRTVGELRASHQPTEKLSDPELELNLSGGNRENAAIAMRIISAFRGTKCVWDNIDSRIAASHRDADNAGFMGFAGEGTRNTTKAWSSGQPTRWGRNRSPK